MATTHWGLQGSSSGAPAGVPKGAVETLLQKLDFSFWVFPTNLPPQRHQMATKKVNTQTIDLECLTQAQVGWIIGRSSRWIRDNSHHFVRNTDGSYDSRHVFSTVAALLGTTTIPAEKTRTTIDFLRDPRNCKRCHNGIDLDCETHQIIGHNPASQYGFQ